MEYASDSVSVVFLGKPITGFHDGTFVSAVRTGDAGAIHKGADGKGTVVWNADKSGTVTITLAQSSPSNKDLSIAAATRASGPIMIKDTKGASYTVGDLAIVGTLPTVEDGQDLSARVWVLQVDNLTIYEAGNE